MAGVIEDFRRALKEIAKLGSMNNKPFGKYERGSWMNVPNGEVRYKDAFWRHILEGPEGIDPETKLPHDVAIAWNALARLDLRLRREESQAATKLNLPSSRAYEEVCSRCNDARCDGHCP